MSKTCRRFRASAALAAATFASTIVSAQTIQDQGAECVKELGPFPTDFSCLAGTIIELTADGKPITHFDAHTKCDRPPLLADVSENGNQCVPYSRLQTKNTSGDVFWTLLCRRYKIVTDKNDPQFADVALIGHKKSTGATCFFQALESATGQPLNGTSVPAPTAGGAENFWLTPTKINQLACYRCHDNDPWIHTPYIDQVTDQNKVPSNAKGKYKFVAFVNQPTQWPVPTYFNLGNNRCVACHRMGTGNSSDEFTQYSTGQLAAPDVTNMFNQYPHSYWMPQPNTKPSVIDWDNVYKLSRDQVSYCYNNQLDTSCNRQTVPTFVPMVAHTQRGLTAPEVFQAEIEGCEMMGYTLDFGPGVPYKSAAFVDERCSCGVRDGVSPEDARNAGWLARQSGKTCVCEFKAGGDADNACAKP